MLKIRPQEFNGITAYQIKRDQSGDVRKSLRHLKKVSIVVPVFAPAVDTSINSFV